ncbi:MAG: exodeoxyribonuclease VII small subunit [Gammaproteobacteria bacterium]
MTKKATTKKSSQNKALDFESALHELESLVDRMEQGETTLEESLTDFERGVALFRQCQKALDEAEQKVQILMKNSGADSLEPFDDLNP